MEVKKRKPASLTVKLIGVPSMEDFNCPDLTALTSGVSICVAVAFASVVNLRLATTGPGLTRGKVSIG